VNPDRNKPSFRPSSWRHIFIVYIITRLYPVFSRTCLFLSYDAQLVCRSWRMSWCYSLWINENSGFSTLLMFWQVFMLFNFEHVLWFMMHCSHTKGIQRLRFSNQKLSIKKMVKLCLNIINWKIKYVKDRKWSHLTTYIGKAATTRSSSYNCRKTGDSNQIGTHTPFSQESVQLARAEAIGVFCFCLSMSRYGIIGPKKRSLSLRREPLWPIHLPLIY
jgi:hypothetical protein